MKPVKTIWATKVIPPPPPPLPPFPFAAGDGLALELQAAIAAESSVTTRTRAQRWVMSILPSADACSNLVTLRTPVCGGPQPAAPGSSGRSSKPAKGADATTLSVTSCTAQSTTISPSCGGHRGCDSQQDERRAPGRRSTIGSRRSPSGRASGTGSGCGPRWLSAWPPSRLGVHTTAAHRAMFRGSESSHFLIDWSIDSESAPARVVAVGESGGPVEPTIGQLDFGPVLRSVAIKWR